MVVLAFLLAIAIEPVFDTGEDALAPPHVFLRAGDGCDRAAATGEVVVCGNKDRDERYRLRPIEKGAYRDEPVRAEMNLGGGKLSLHNEDKDLGGGQHSKRAMVTLTLPFYGLVARLGARPYLPAEQGSLLDEHIR